MLSKLRPDQIKIGEKKIRRKILKKKDEAVTEARSICHARFKDAAPGVEVMGRD